MRGSDEYYLAHRTTCTVIQKLSFPQLANFICATHIYCCSHHKTLTTVSRLSLPLKKGDRTYPKVTLLASVFTITILTAISIIEHVACLYIVDYDIWVTTRYLRLLFYSDIIINTTSIILYEWNSNVSWINFWGIKNRLHSGSIPFVALKIEEFCWCITDCDFSIRI